MSPWRKVAITSGDVDGVGLEVSVKALSLLGPQRKTQFILFRSPQALPFRLPRTWTRVQVTSLEEALHLPAANGQLIEVLSDRSPARWVEEAASACLQQRLGSMVTGPLSKQEIQNSGMKDIGHTDILKRLSRRKRAFMCFMGPKFNVILASGHIPTCKVESVLTADLLTEALQAAASARVHLPKSSRNKPLGVLGLNPHAGDLGLIGHFDQSVLSPVLQSLKKQLNLVGPLVPDVAFLPENWKKYSLFVAQYHDQGLIPFKMIHGFDAGVHLTLGLPILRSSVDHGTAKDLFGRNKANPGSMIEALKWGVRLAQKG